MSHMNFKYAFDLPQDVVLILQHHLFQGPFILDTFPMFGYKHLNPTSLVFKEHSCMPTLQVVHHAVRGFIRRQNRLQGRHTPSKI